MRNIIEELVNNSIWKEVEWLIVGKGPTSSLYHDELSDVFCIATLNDAIREVNCATIAHFVDFEAYIRCEAYLERAEKVVLPWYPHIDSKPQKQSLEELIKQHSSLKKLNTQGRLCWYDLSSAQKQTAEWPVVSAVYFSSEAVLHILVLAGVKKIRTIGIDGGTQYGVKYKDLEKISLLTNKQTSFDKQFESLAQVISKYGIDFGPMNVELPVKIFIAATQSEYLPVKVLEYSIKSKASVTTQIQALCELGIDIPVPKHESNRARTPFSFQRFVIPKACDYKGRAIYLDSDMLVFKDILDLWNRDFGSSNVLSAYSIERGGRLPQFSVMLMNCAQLKWDIAEIIAKLDAGEFTYESLMYDFELADSNAVIEPNWNSFEKYDQVETGLLHYTDMPIQPWVSVSNPLAHLWVKSLMDAIDSGFIPFSFLKEEVEKGHVRPSLIYQIENNIDDPILLPKQAKELDRFFKAPYTSIQNHHRSPWKSMSFKIKAKARQIFYESNIARVYRALRS